jgi:hypothetical protein
MMKESQTSKRALADQEAYTSKEPPLSGTGTGTTDISSVQRFDVDLSVDGSLRPGTPIQLRLSARNTLEPTPATVRITLPEAALLQRARGKQKGKQPRVSVEMNETLSSAVEVNQHMGSGQTVNRTKRVTIEEPGYYRVLATAHAPDAPITAKDGRWIDNLTSRVLWIYLSEEGGQITDRFNPDLLPDDARKQPGPLTMRDERFRFTTSSSASSSGQSTAKLSGPIDLSLSYVQIQGNVVRPVEDAEVEVTLYQGQNDQAVNGYSRDTDAQGRVTLSCPGNGYYAIARVYADNSVVNVNDTYSQEMATYHFDDNDCGDMVSLNADSRVAHTYLQMSDAIDASRSFFNHSRGEIQVVVGSRGSVYDPGEDRIYLEESDADGGEFNNFIISHEYGHALHEKGLQGNEGGNCPRPHFLSGAHNLTCAFSEGFANYHAVVTVDNYVRGRVEYNYYYPGRSTTSTSTPLDDGSIIEGAVAAFFYDLTDPANESHDNLNFPGSYVADIIETCEVDGARADGIDQIITCLQKSTVNYNDYFPNRSLTSSGWTEGATEPSGWDRTDIRKLWYMNLYGEVYVPPVHAGISGSQYLDEYETGSWTASASGGTGGGYTYDWEVSRNAGSTWFGICGGSSTCTYDAGAISSTLDARIRLTVSDGNDSDTAQKSFIVNNNGGGDGGGGDIGCESAVSTNRICL